MAGIACCEAEKGGRESVCLRITIGINRNHAGGNKKKGAKEK